jgi:hypothetical protein
MHFILGIFLNLCRSTKPWADPLSASSAIACTRWSLVAMLVPGILVMDCKPSAVRAASGVTVVTIHSVALSDCRVVPSYREGLYPAASDDRAMYRRREHRES